MTRKQIDIIESILNMKLSNADIVLVSHVGSRSQIYRIKNIFAVKIFTKDYDAEIVAYGKLNGLNFLPQFYGKNDEMKIIVIEWVNGDFFDEYIRKYRKLPDDFIKDYFHVKIEMCKRGCYDYDSKICELCWNSGKIRKVDYGQVEYCDNNIVINKQLGDLYTQKEKLLDNNDTEWSRFCQKVLYPQGVSNDIVIKYRKSL